MREMNAMNRRSSPGSSEMPSGAPPARSWHSRSVACVMKARRCASEAGSATAEYAVATLAACGFAGLLLAILRSSEMKSLLLGIIKRALAVG